MTIVERRKNNIEIFKNTMELCHTHPKLRGGIKNSIEEQVVLDEKAPYWFDEKLLVSYEEKAKIVVSEKRSFEAAREYARVGKKVCVLNFADWTTPGGWVLKGASAQEESLCRCSTLYPCISDPNVENFYASHKAEKKKNPMHILHNDDLIYTPNVTVFKSDTDMPEILPEEEWYQVDVISCAAPRLRLRSADQKKLGLTSDVLEIEEEELRRILDSRIRRIIESARYCSGGSIEVLILGGFGCGAFRNPPEFVAQTFNKVINDFIYDFEIIEFPIFHKNKEVANYEAFCKYITSEQ
ncbi:MAG: TIGR02452 family protein [Clostridia bacterium]|nr:TIGR02452 family protein [Clostridia bacterium]